MDHDWTAIVATGWTSFASGRVGNGLLLGTIGDRIDVGRRRGVGAWISAMTMARFPDPVST